MSYVISIVRSRCDQCVRYGQPEKIAPKIREFGGKGGTVGVACTGCGEDESPNGGGPIVLIGDRCVGCLLDDASRAR